MLRRIFLTVALFPNLPAQSRDSLSHDPALPKLCANANKMAAFLQWRKFVFFDKEVVKEHGGTGKNVVLPSGISACDSGRGHIVLGDIL